MALPEMQWSGIPLHADHGIAQISTYQVSTGAVERTITRAQTHGVHDLVTNARCNKVSVVSRHHCSDGIAAKIACVRGEGETVEALGKAHGSVIFPAAIQAGDGSELAAHAGIDFVLIAEILNYAGAEIGGHRR